MPNRLYIKTIEEGLNLGKNPGRTLKNMQDLSIERGSFGGHSRLSQQKLEQKLRGINAHGPCMGSGE